MVKNRLQEENFPILSSKLLGIFAHPDDELVGFGGTLLKNIENGGKVHIICFGGWSKKRREEFKQVAKFCGFTYTLLKRKEGSYNSREPGLLKQLIEEVREFQPDYIVTHREENDYHPEHRYVSSIAKQVAISAQTSKKGWLAKGILFTEGHFPHENFHVAVDVTKQFDKSIEAFKLHASQIDKNDGYYLQTAEKRSALRGAQLGCKYAEVFKFQPILVIGSFNRGNIGL